MLDSFSQRVNFFFLIIPNSLIKNYTKPTSEIKISKYITTLTKNNSNLTKLVTLIEKLF